MTAAPQNLPAKQDSAWLAGRTTVEVDRALLDGLRSGPGLQPVIRGLLIQGENLPNLEVTSTTGKRLERAAIERGLAMVDQAFAPADPAWLARAIATLAVLTARPQRDDSEIELTIEAFIRKLSDYPADVVTSVLNAWADTHKFFPAWAELKEELDRTCKRRVEIRQALVHALTQIATA
jgi:hypothetical protein